MTTDEELNLLNSQLRRLKIEYEIYFNNPTKKPPTDVEWKVLSLLRKFSDGGRMSFSQRFRYNEMAQRYAIYSDLWRKKARIREEGYRRPQDALLSVQGVRPDEEHKAQHPPVYGLSQGAAATAGASQPFTMQSDDMAEHESWFSARTALESRHWKEHRGSPTAAPVCLHCLRSCRLFPRRSRPARQPTKEREQTKIS